MRLCAVRHIVFHVACAAFRCDALPLSDVSYNSGRAVAQAVCFLRPTRENIARIRRELRDPRYGQYHLCETLVTPMAHADHLR